MTKKSTAKKIRKMEISAKKRSKFIAKQLSDPMNQKPGKDEIKDLKKHIKEKLLLMGFTDQYEIFRTNKIEERNELRLKDKVDRETGEVIKNDKGEPEKELYVEKVKYNKLMVKNFVKGLARRIKNMTRAEIDNFLHLDHVAYKEKLEKARQDAMDRAAKAEAEKVVEENKTEKANDIN